jgi:hypothetical protein
MKKIILLFSFFISTFSFTYAQQWLWGRQPTPHSLRSFGEATSDHCAAVDKAGNVYSAGYMGDTLQYGPYTLIARTYGLENMFLVKYDKLGNLRWATQPLQVQRISFGIATSLAVDASSNIYVAGTFGDTLSFGGHKVGSVFNQNVFLAKYDSNGNIVWVKQGYLPSKYSSGDANSVALDNFGNVYLSGEFIDTLQLGLTTLISNAPKGDPFLAKFDQNGNFIWAKQAIPASNSCSGYGNSIAVDHTGNIYLTGYFVDTLSFGADTLASVAIHGDLYLAKYDSSGKVIWAKQGGTPNKFSMGYGYALGIDGSSGVYVAGDFMNALTLGSATLSSSFYTQAFLAKYDSNGNVIWAKQTYPLYNFNCYGYSLAFDTIKGDGGYLVVYCSGYQPVSIKFSQDTIMGILKNNETTMVIKFDTAGSVLRSNLFSEGTEDDADAFAVDHSGKYAYIFGDLGDVTDTTIFGNDTLIYGNDVPFVARWNTADTSKCRLTLTTIIDSNISCPGDNNGKATADPSGGTAPYIYLWTGGGGTSASASNLMAGDYYVTVQDANGCAAKALATIVEPYSLNVSINILANVSCNGGSDGSVSATVYGGTGARTYSWSGGGGTNDVANNLTAGTYTLTVKDANGCTAIDSVTITQPASLSLAANTVANVSCNGGIDGSVSSTVSGGMAPYTYSWTGGGGTNSSASNLTAGSYTVTVWDANGCTETASVSLTQPSSLNVSTNIAANVLCNGGRNGSASCTVSGGTGLYTYLWSNSLNTPSISSLSAGTYTLKVTDSNGCTSTAMAVITQPSALNITVDSLNASDGCNGTAWAAVSGGTKPYTYLWTGGLTTDTIRGQCAGSYCCVITDASGCVDSLCINIIETAGIGNISNNSENLILYPNPNNGQFAIKWSGASGQSSVEIYNMLGEKIYSKTFSAFIPIAIGTQLSIDLSSQASGIYLYRVINESSSLAGEGKFIIQK